MTSDRDRWDSKYRGALGSRMDPPDPFVLARLDELGPGQGRTALDLAAGTGRHTMELLRRGWATTAWDVSSVALELLAGHARSAELQLEERDLVAHPDLAGSDPFDLALAVDFLDRPLWERLAEFVVPGGHVLVRTFTMDWPKPKPPERYRLRPGELAGGLPGLETILVQECDGRAGLLGRRA